LRGWSHTQLCLIAMLRPGLSMPKQFKCQDPTSAPIGIRLCIQSVRDERAHTGQRSGGDPPIAHRFFGAFFPMLRARITATTNARLDYVLICPKLEPLQVLVGSSRKILGGREDSWRKRCPRRWMRLECHKSPTVEPSQAEPVSKTIQFVALKHATCARPA
jgi:hypothetical protein